MELLQRAKAGDADAVDTICAQFYPRVQELVHKGLQFDIRSGRPWLLSRFSTGDVVQEVFRSVLTDLRSFGGRNEDAFVGYLATVVRNRLVDALRFHQAARRDGRVPVIGEAGIANESSSEGDPATKAVFREEFERFRAAMATFPEREQLLLRARFEETASFQTLADQLGYPTSSTARRAFHTAQAKLLILLGKA